MRRLQRRSAVGRTTSDRCKRNKDVNSATHVPKTGLDSFDGRQVGDSQWIPSLFIRIVVELNSTKYGDLTLQSLVYTIVLVQAICGLFRSVN